MMQALSGKVCAAAARERERGYTIVLPHTNMCCPANTQAYHSRRPLPLPREGGAIVEEVEEVQIETEDVEVE